jgi:hypothetical protein
MKETLSKVGSVAEAQAVLERAGDDVVTIRGGIQATIMSSATGSMARWVEKGVAFAVIGERATRDQLLATVERI